MLTAIYPFGTIAQSADLFIFFPQDARKETVQQDIAQACPNMRVTVFDRAESFWRALQNSSPSAILTTGLAFNHLDNYIPMHEGTLNNTTAPPYHLIAIDQSPPTPRQLNQKRIGVLNELGRRPGHQYYKKILTANIKLKQVSKPQDLLPLLTFKAVDFLMVNQGTMRYLKRTSKQTLQSRDIKLNIPLAVAGAHTAAPATVQKGLSSCVEGLSAQPYNQTYFSVDTWKRLKH